MERKSLILLVVLLSIGLSACRQKKDPEISQRREEVNRLSAENRNLKQRIDLLENQLSEQSERLADLEENAQQKASSPQTAAAENHKPPGMTVEKARAELEPILNQLVDKLKARRDTAGKANQFGMRFEYRVNAAVYGLIHNSEPDTPYLAKVLVPYEKFLETKSGSKSYGTETARFLFGYRKQKWVLLSNE